MQEVINFLSHHLLLTNIAILLLLLVFIIEWMRGRRQIFSITPAQTTQMINRDQAVVIDLRGQEAYQQGHIIDALCFSPADLQQSLQKIEKFRAKPLIFIANTGLEAQKIAAKALKQGYNAYALSGGIRAWIEAQMPLIKGN